LAQASEATPADGSTSREKECSYEGEGTLMKAFKAVYNFIVGDRIILIGVLLPL
jgi:hypothetical protein